MTHLLLRAGSLLCAGYLIGAAVYAADFPAVRGDRASGCRNRVPRSWRAMEWSRLASP
jgi:hypothetical protein